MHVLNELTLSHIVGVSEGGCDILTSGWIKLPIVTYLVDLMGEGAIDDVSVFGAKVLEANCFVEI